MSVQKLKKALTFSVSGALLAGTLAVGCEKPMRTSNPGPEPEERVNTGPETVEKTGPDAGAAEDSGAAVELPELRPTVNPGPEPVPEPDPEPEPDKK